MNRKIKLQLIFGVIITAVIVYFSIYVIKSLNMSVIFRADVNWGLVALAVLIYIYSNYIRGLAFSRGIDPEMNRITALEIVGLGHALNMVLPLHAGEGLRLAFFPSSYPVARRTKLLLISFAADSVIVLIITALTVPFAGFTDRTLLNAMWIVLYIVIGLLAVFAALIVFVPRIKNYVKEYLNRSLLKMTFWVALSWIMLVSVNWLGLVAFGFEPVASIKMALAVFVATNIVNLVPASPGAIGLFEYGTIVALQGFGVDKNVALSASLLLHVIQYLALLPLGTFLYIKVMRGKYAEAVKAAWKTDGGADEQAAEK